MRAHWEIGLGKVDASKKDSHSEDNKGQGYQDHVLSFSS